MDLGRVDDYEQAVKDFEEIKPQILGDYDPEKNGLPVVGAYPVRELN
jgi:hypothetical protein